MVEGGGVKVLTAVGERAARGVESSWAGRAESPEVDVDEDVGAGEGGGGAGHRHG